MKVTMTFNLPDDESEYQIVSKAGTMASVLWDILMYMRAIINDKIQHSLDMDTAETINSKIYDLMEEAGLREEDLG